VIAELGTVAVPELYGILNPVDALLSHTLSVDCADTVFRYAINVGLVPNPELTPPIHIPTSVGDATAPFTKKVMLVPTDDVPVLAFSVIQPIHINSYPCGRTISLSDMLRSPPESCKIAPRFILAVAPLAPAELVVCIISICATYKPADSIGKKDINHLQMRCKNKKFDVTI